MNALLLTKKLISIPSYVDRTCDEKKIGEFIFEYLKQFPFLTVEKQQVKNGRFNIIARDNFPTKVLWSGHIDTVQKQNGWRTDPLKPIVKNRHLYGLGASDMKSGIAALLSSLRKIEGTKGLMLLFYVDEEYDFFGTKAFVKEYKNKIKPEYIISGDGKKLSVGNACKGLIEISATVKGETAHASQPQKGKNALLRSFAAIDIFGKTIEKIYSTADMKTVYNLAFLQGGLDQRNDKNEIILGRQGNLIPDICEFVLEIRPADPKLKGEKVVNILQKFLKEQELVIETMQIRHDLGAWTTKRSDLSIIENEIEKTIPVKYLNTQEYGYIDLQLLWQAFNNVSCFTFGPGIVGHVPNESVPVENIKIAEKIYIDILKKLVEAKR